MNNDVFSFCDLYDFQSISSSKENFVMKKPFLVKPFNIPSKNCIMDDSSLVNYSLTPEFDELIKQVIDEVYFEDLLCELIMLMAISRLNKYKGD